MLSARRSLQDLRLKGVSGTPADALRAEALRGIAVVAVLASRCSFFLPTGIVRARGQ